MRTYSPRRYVRSTRTGRRRATIWNTYTLPNTGVTAGSNLTNADLLAGLESGGVGIYGGTIMRVHLWLSLTGTSTDTNPGVTWGMVIWDKTLLANAPQASTDFFADWMMLRNISPGTTPCAVNTSTPSWLYGNEFDVKARRRLHEMNDTLTLSLHNNGSGSANVGIFARTLIALP